MTCIRCNDTRQFTFGHAVITCSNCIPGDRYAGIGSCETPIAICRQMENVAMQLALRGFVLRSGRGKKRVEHAKNESIGSADLAFEAGCDIIRGQKVIRIANEGTAALEHASRFHPNWAACDDHARALHARNSLVMLGDWLDDPVKFVLCWTTGSGGTAQALRIAKAYEIPVFNLATMPLDAFWSWINA